MAGTIVEARKFQKDRKDAGLTRVEARNLPTYGGSFDDAFAKANANGDKAFIWAGDGKPYNTNVYDWNARTKVQKSYANSREKLLGRRRWKTVPEDRFRTIGLFNPETGLTRYFIEDRLQTAENELTSQNASLSEPTWMSSPKQLVKDNSGRIMSFDSPQAAKKFMKSEEFADYAGHLEVETPRHKIPKRKREQEGLQPIYRTDLMGDNGMRDGQTRLWFDSRSRLYFLADKNGDIMWFTPDPNCENEGWGTTPGSNGFVPVNNRTDQFREAWADYLLNMNQASETAGASPYTRPDLYGALYPNPVAQDIRAGRDDFYRGAFGTGKIAFRFLPGLLDTVYTHTLPWYKGEPYTVLYDDLYKGDFRSINPHGWGNVVDDLYAGGRLPYGGKVVNFLNDVGDWATASALLGTIINPEMQYKDVMYGTTTNREAAGLSPTAFEKVPVGQTAKLNPIYRSVYGSNKLTRMSPERGETTVYNYGKNSPGGIGNGYSATVKVWNGQLGEWVEVPVLNIAPPPLGPFEQENYFYWMPKQYQPTFFDYYGGNPMPTTYVKTGGTDPFNGKYVIIGPQLGYGDLNMRSGIPYGEYLETMGPAPDNVKVETTEHNMIPGYKIGGRLGFPVFKNGGIVKGLNNLDTDVIDVPDKSIGPPPVIREVLLNGPSTQSRLDLSRVDPIRVETWMKIPVDKRNLLEERLVGMRLGPARLNYLIGHIPRYDATKYFIESKPDILGNDHSQELLNIIFSKAKRDLKGRADRNKIRKGTYKPEEIYSPARTRVASYIKDAVWQAKELAKGLRR